MPANKRRRQRVGACNNANATSAKRSPPPLPPIPLDLVIEILARSDDAGTLVRGAAASKPLRRAVLDPAFRRRLTTTRCRGGFDPGLFLGVSYASGTTYSPGYQRLRDVGQLPPPPRNLLRFHEGLLKASEPVASRGGLVVLRRRMTTYWQRFRDDLCVCDSLTGHTSDLPGADIRSVYAYVVLAVGGGGGGADAGRSFELLIADGSLRTQTFSSEHGEWGAVRETELPARRLRLPISLCPASRQPVVLGRTAVHGLTTGHNSFEWRIVALDVAAARATTIALPPECVDRMDMDERPHSRGPLLGPLLVSSADGRRLSLLIAEFSVISMWTMSPPAAAPEGNDDLDERPSWSRQVVVERHPMDIGDKHRLVGRGMRFLAFGERSGTVILQMQGDGLVRLQLGSGEKQVLSRRFKGRIEDTHRLDMCMHETDLCSLLQAMKPF